MVEFGCLETRTLKFCNGAEYRADISKSKNIKTKDRQRIFKSLKMPSKAIFYYQPESILALATKRSWTNKNQTISITLIHKYSRTKTSVLFSAADTIVLFFNTCNVQITELQRMRKDINVLNETFRLFNRLLMSGIAFLMNDYGIFTFGATCSPTLYTPLPTRLTPSSNGQDTPWTLVWGPL